MIPLTSSTSSAGPVVNSLHVVKDLMSDTVILTAGDGNGGMVEDGLEMSTENSDSKTKILKKFVGGDNLKDQNSTMLHILKG